MARLHKASANGRQSVPLRLNPGLLAPPQPIPDPGRGAGAPRPPRTANSPRQAALRRRGTAHPHTAAGEAARAALQPDHGCRTALLQRRSTRPMAGNGRGPGARVSVHMVVICAAPAAARRQDGMARERGQRDQERRSGPAHARTSVSVLSNSRARWAGKKPAWRAAPPPFIILRLFK